MSALDRTNKARSLLEEAYNELGDALREITAQLDAKDKRIAELEKELAETYSKVISQDIAKSREETFEKYAAQVLNSQPQTRLGFKVGDRVRMTSPEAQGSPYATGVVVSLLGSEDNPGRPEIQVIWDCGMFSSPPGQSWWADDLEVVPAETPKTKGGFAVGDRIQHKQYGHLSKNWHGKVISLRPPKGFSDADLIVQWDEGVGSDKEGFPAHTDQIEHENPKHNKAVQDSAVASADCRHWSKL